MSTGFEGPSPGRYHGDDPAAARAFREIQQAFERLKRDAIYLITERTAIVGTYKAVAYGVRCNLTLDVLPDRSHWGFYTDPTNKTVLAVNMWESPTNAASTVPLKTPVVGSLAPNNDLTPVLFFTCPTNLASTYIDVGGTNTGTGGTGDGGGGVDGGGDGGGGGGGGGGGTFGGGGDGSCRWTYTATFTSNDPGEDPAGLGPFTLTWDGSEWNNGEGAPGPIELQGSPGAWQLRNPIWYPHDTYTNHAGTTCPPTGTYATPDDGGFHREGHIS